MNYHKISHCNMVNGTGLRTVIWVSGCSHKCKGCFNQETWDETSGIKFNNETKKELFKNLNEDWCSGLTFTGGDPFNHTNIDEIISLMKEAKELFPTKTIWLYTGYTWEQVIHDEKMASSLKYIDVLCDGKFIEELKSPEKYWVGSSNQNVIDVKNRLKLLQSILL